MFTKIITLCLSLLSITLLSHSQVPPPTLQQGEYWTKLFSASYDYQTNGSVRYIVQNPSSPNGLCAILMAQEDSTNRFIFVSYSSDGGRNWTKGNVNNTTNWGFPCIEIRNGVPVIAMHKSSSAQRTAVFQDISFGGLSYSEITGFPVSPSIQWSHLATASNNNLLIVGSTASPPTTANFTIYNGTSWTPFIELPNTGGASGQFTTEGGPGGLMYIFGANIANPILPLGNKLWLSTNNGLNFTLQTGTNAPPESLPNGSSILASYLEGGKSGIFVGNEVHLVYTVYDTSSVGLASPPNTAWYKSCKIIHWSQSTGVDTVAARYNMPLMTDTLTHALVAPLCQPSMGYYNGYIYVIFTAFLRGNKQTVDDGSQVNAGEIFLTRSSDNGNTWSAPVNLTNTPSIEEKHPSAIRRFNLSASDSVGIFYIRDMKAGGWVNVASWGKAPVYGIYKKISPLVLGINNNHGSVQDYTLFQNYPNPFNPATTISYYLEKNSFVTLKIYNILGEEISTLVNEEQRKGAKEISFITGNLPSGVYFYTLRAGEFTDTKSMVIIK